MNQKITPLRHSFPNLSEDEEKALSIFLQGIALVFLERDRHIPDSDQVSSEGYCWHKLYEATQASLDADDKNPDGDESSKVVALRKELTRIYKSIKYKSES